MAAGGKPVLPQEASPATLSLARRQPRPSCADPPARVRSRVFSSLVLCRRARRPLCGERVFLS
jgi:hypothetical protein